MPSTRHGGIEHQYWKEKVAAKLRDFGYTVREEYPIGNGKTVDLVARKNGKKIAIEIETGKSDAVANVRKCLDSGFETVLSLATTGRATRELHEQVRGMGDSRHGVSVLSVQELLDAQQSGDSWSLERMQGMKAQGRSEIEEVRDP